MKQKLLTAWTAFKEAFGFLVIGWAMILVTLLVIRITTPEAIANADVSYWGVIGALITLVTVPIHYWFKKRQSNKCDHK